MKLTDRFENLAGVYIITCKVNGKIYVGESVNINKRIKRYFKEKTQLIAKAIDKYGADNFDISVEYFPNATKPYLLNKEEDLISNLNSLTPFGYNVCRKGIDGTGRKHNQETKNKIGEAHKGKYVSDETRRKLSIASKGRLPSLESTRKKIESQNKPILQIDAQTGEIIKEWTSIKEATQSLSDGKNRSGDISKAIKGVRLKSAFGYKWTFKL